MNRKFPVQGLPLPEAGASGVDFGDRRRTSLGRIVVIEERKLTRDLLKCGLEAIGDVEVVTVATIEEWIAQAGDQAVALVICGLRSGKLMGDAEQKLATLASRDAPVVVMADVSDDVEFVTWVLEQGARGYIATDLPLDVAFQAMCLVSAGGTYVPASCLYARSSKPPMPKVDPVSRLFTARQAAVIDALRRGKANKTIAYELNMRESTVKVHVRNIMRKLKARNRTEVAYMTKQLMETGLVSP